MSADVVESPVAPQFTLTEADILTLTIERILKTMPQAEMPVEHDFCHGVYARTIHLKQGICLVGEIHRNECFFVVRSGNLAVTTNEGAVVVGAGFQSVTTPGQKRLGIALTDCVVTTYHANPKELRNPDEIKEYYTVMAPKDVLEMIDRFLLEAKV